MARFSHEVPSLPSRFERHHYCIGRRLEASTQLDQPWKFPEDLVPGLDTTVSRVQRCTFRTAAAKMSGCYYFTLVC